MTNLESAEEADLLLVVYVCVCVDIECKIGIPAVCTCLYFACFFDAGDSKPGKFMEFTIGPGG